MINTDNQNETEIFFRENIPLDTRDFVDLIPTLPNVKDLMLEDFYSISIRMEFWEPTPTFVDVKLEFDFQVQWFLIDRDLFVGSFSIFHFY